MQIPINTFKQALRQGKPQIGLWLGLAWLGRPLCRRGPGGHRI